MVEYCQIEQNTCIGVNKGTMMQAALPVVVKG